MEINNYIFTGHQYTVGSTGLKKNCDKTFLSRQTANNYMYRLCKKYDLDIIEVYDDKHSKTYVCNNGIKFFVNRI